MTMMPVVGGVAAAAAVSAVAAFAAVASLAAVAGLAAVPASAATWPSRPVRVVVTFPPGGSSDIVARLISSQMAERLGQPLVVDNRPGAGGTLGAGIVALAQPDGHTLVLSNTAPFSVSPFIYPSVRYDPVKSFTHIASLGAVPNVIVVHPSVQAKTLPELVTLMRSGKGPVNYGSSGAGSVGHVVGELFQREFKVAITHVPYKGAAPMLVDLLANQIPIAFDTLPQSLPHGRSGALRVLAVTSAKRVAAAPEIPAVGELGFPRLIAENWLGLSGPAGVPRPIADTLHRQVTEVLALPTIWQRMDELGIARRPMSSAEFETFVANEVAAWQPVMKAAGIRVE
jgi:tripartite-type tricarboxylate transporter receptor subunit TctC